MIKLNVEINSKNWIKKIKIPKKYFNKKLKKIPKNITFLKDRNIVFTILLTNTSYIKKLNKKFRNKNEPTDVLSFPYFPYNNLKLSKKKYTYIGDIAICYEIISNRSNKSNFFSEFDKAWVHGFLHLLGFDHAKNKDYFIMNRIEKKILNSIP
jgi:probable rRNA maturation factor